MQRSTRWSLIVVLGLLVAASCTRATPTPTATQTLPVTPAPTATPTPTPTPTPTKAPVPTPTKQSVTPAEGQPGQYALRLQVAPTEGGTVKVLTAPEAGDRYPAGAVIKLLASPNQGFVFVFWKIETPAGTSTSKEIGLTITMTSDLKISAVFEKGTEKKAEKPGQPRAMMPVCPPTVGTSPPPPPVSPPSKATGPISLKVVGQIGGSTRAVAVQGNYAYVSVGLRLVALYVADPMAPRELGATEALEGYVQDVTVAGSFAYVAAGGGGVYIASLSNPAQPKVVGSYDTPGYAEGVAVVGRYAYVADGPGGLRILDVSDPAKPAQVAVAYTMNYAFAVALAGKYAYVAAAGAGLLVADVSNPARPVELGRYDTPGYAYGVAVSENTAYVADGWEGLQVVDVSDPRQPKGVGLYDTPGWAMDVLAVGARVYVADAFGGLRVVDASDKAKPTELGSFQVPGGHAAKLALSGGTAFVADIYQGVHVVDVSAPAQPRRVGLYSPLGWAQAVEVAGGYAYVAAMTYGLRVIDLADPAHPREVATLDTEENPAVTVALSGSSAYVGTLWGPKRPVGLYALDISDPLHPKGPPPQPFTGHVGLVATSPTLIEKTPWIAGDVLGGPPRSVFIQGTTLYIASEWGLLLIDISSALAPCELAFLQTSFSSLGGNTQTVAVAVSGSVAYLAVSKGGLYTVDVSNPRRPTLLGVFNEPAVVGPKKKEQTRPVSMLDVVVAEPFAYVLDGDILRVVDVSDPRRMKGLGSFPLPVMPLNNSGGAARSLTFYGGKLFVVDGPAGLLVLDAADPAKPQLAGQLRLPDLASWVTVDEKHVYVSSGQGGLFVIEWSHGSPSTKVSTTEQEGLALTSTGSAPFSGTPSQGAARVAQPGLETAAEHAAFPAYRLASPRLAAPLSLPAAAPGAAAASTCAVTSTADSGPGTLRRCLETARSGDTITFDSQVFPPEKPATIRLTGTLSLSQGGITIDGSDAGVILDGSSAPPGTTGLSVGGSGNVVKGLQILYFNIGIGMEGSRNIVGGPTPADRNIVSGNDANIMLKLAFGNLIVGNYIGTDASGRKRLGGRDGVALIAGSWNNRVERNVIVGDFFITDPGSSYNEVVGNYIGVDATGTVAFEGGGSVSVGLPFNRIGGTRPSEGNVISGSINVFASDVVVVGNLIGTDATGKKALGTGVVGLGNGARHNFVGGTTEAERNVINFGVSLGTFASYNFIAGNYIGTDASGAISLGASGGIALGNAESNTIQSNLISGGQRAGLRLGPGANFNWVRANRITQSSKVGVEITESQGNVIVGNSFTNNGRNASDQGTGNRWDDGNEGNYWDAYTGRDTNGDGVGDTPYVIAPNGIDSRPSMRPR